MVNRKKYQNFQDKNNFALIALIKRNTVSRETFYKNKSRKTDLSSRMVFNKYAEKEYIFC